VLATEFFWLRTPTPAARELFLGEARPGLRFDGIKEWVGIYGGAGLAHISTDCGPFEMMTTRGFLADEGRHTAAEVGRGLSRPAYVRKVMWLMPRMARALPYLGYVLVMATKPQPPGESPSGEARQ
jgi:hypothetical protein